MRQKQLAPFPFYMKEKVLAETVSDFFTLINQELCNTGLKKIPIQLSSLHAKKVMSNSPGLVDFAIGLVMFVLNLPDGQVLFFWSIQITKGL